MTPILAWVWQPIISPLHVLGGSGILVGLALFAYARSFKAQPFTSLGLLAMRLAVIAVLAVLLMGPSVIPPYVELPGRPKLLIFTDTSGSMLTKDCQGLSRLGFVKENWLNREKLRELSELYDLRYFGFDSEVRPLSATALQQPEESLATGRVSQIAECLRASLWKLGGKSFDDAMLVFSDGHDSQLAPFGPVALLARARGVPVHTVCLGGPTLQRDLVLVAVANQQYMLVGEEGQIVAKVHQVGLTDAKVSLHLRCGQEHWTRQVGFEGKESVTVKLPVKQEKTGLYEYKISVDPVAGETELGNNTQSVFLEVTDQRIKVLLLEGEPFWDTKFIAQSLRKDAQIELTQITQLSRGKRRTILTRAEQRSAELPVTAKELSEYNVIILGRGVEHLLDSETAKLLPEFVRGYGGSVVFARGRAYDPNTPLGRQTGRDLAVLEPVVWAVGLRHNLSLRLTQAGQHNPCFNFGAISGNFSQVIGDLPGLTVMPGIAQEKTATVVLARASAPGKTVASEASQDPPALVSMNYGRGRVVAVLGEGLWRWSFLPPELSELEGLYDLLWSNIIRWLAMGSDFLPGQEVSLKLARSSVRLGEPLQCEAVSRFMPEGGFNPQVMVLDPQGKTHSIVMNRLGQMDSRLQGEFTPQTTGVHQVVLECPQLKPGTIQKRFNSYDVDMERLQTSANPEAMRILAEQSAGRYFEPAESERLSEELAKIRAMRQVPRRPEYIWPRGIILVVLLLWAGAEWIIRKRCGLL